MRHDRPRRPIPSLTPADDVDHMTVRTLRFPATQGYARRPLVTPTRGDDTRLTGPSPERVSRFNDYPGE